MTGHQTLQAAMRFGRDGEGAVVYVHTDTFPEWVPLAGEGRVIRTRSEGERQVIEAIEDVGSGRTRDIVDHPAVERSERQVRTHLNRLAESGHLSRTIESGGYVWRDDGIHRVNALGEVELDPVSIDALDENRAAEVVRSSNYTWNFRTSSVDCESSPPATGSIARADGPSPNRALETSPRRDD